MAGQLLTAVKNDECNRCAACLVLQQKEKVLQDPSTGIYQCPLMRSVNGMIQRPLS